MYLVHIPKILRKFLNRKLIWEISSCEKEIYLTFDDGPTPGVTEKVLDILEKYQAGATFFCVGKQVKENPVLYQKILQSGHSVGNHTFNHVKAKQPNTDRFLSDVRKAAAYIQSDLFRPPYGRIKNKQIRKLVPEYRIIMWSVLSGDFDKKASKEGCLQNVLRYTRPGSIIVFHDSGKAAEKLLYVLPRILEIYTKKGFCFKAIRMGCC